jgi:hypothetical protein
MKKSRTGSMVSKEWVKETRQYFLEFLYVTRFPELTRHGGYGLMFDYPEWLIMLIGVLAVKCKEKTYVGIHCLSTRYWKELCGQEVKLPPIFESQLRECLKNLLSAWRGCRIHLSNFSTRVLAIEWSVPTR